MQCFDVSYRYKPIREWHKTCGLRHVDLPNHAVFGSHDFDAVRVIVEFARVGGEQFVHDARVRHEVGPEADCERFDLRRRAGRIRLLGLLEQVASQRQHRVEQIQRCTVPPHVTQAAVMRRGSADDVDILVVVAESFRSSLCAAAANCATLIQTLQNGRTWSSDRRRLSLRAAESTSFTRLTLAHR